MKKLDEYSEQETQRRMEAAIRRAHKTPHTPNSQLIGKGRKSPKTKGRPAKPKST